MRDKLIEIYTLEEKTYLVNPDHIMYVIDNKSYSTIILSNGTEIETEIPTKEIYRLIHLDH